MHSLPDLRWVSVSGSRQVRRGSAWRASRPAVSQCHAAAEFQGRQAASRLPSGRSVKEVVVERDGETETFGGDIVVVSCGAANSAKLLLMSANDKHPNGLANGSDQVGRNYMFHNSMAVLAISTGAESDVLSKDDRAERFLFRDGRVRFSDGKHPDGRQVGGRDVQRRETARDQARSAGTVE